MTTTPQDSSEPREGAIGGGAQGDFRELVVAFVGRNADHYAAAFHEIGQTRGYSWSFNLAAFVCGPVWLGARYLWGAFWIAIVLEIVAVALAGIGLFGDLGSEATARAERLSAQGAERMRAAQAAHEAGDPLADSMQRSAEAIMRAAEKAMVTAAEARAQAPAFIVGGLLMLLTLRGATGLLANPLLARRFRRWRASPQVAHGFDWRVAASVTLLVFVSYPVVVYRFAFSEVPGWLSSFPANEALTNELARAIDRAVRWTADTFDVFFEAVTSAINAVLDLMEIGLVVTPWPVVMTVIIVLAWQISGARVAIFSAAALAYLAVLGFWEKSMATIALLGTAAFLAVALGIPLGIWCGRNARVYAIVRPVLDFMQTMPAFVYLIPVIAFFGIGKPPGIIATMIFGMPPVVRLTALGLSGVPESVREAATAFGGSRRFLLFKVDLPLAMPSIMAGVNQTLLMCLSMVVIASLIGAKGLGEDVLSALQYAAVGKGILAGLAILMCAMVLDRIVQGRKQS